MDFMSGENTKHGYDAWDLENGIQFCEEYIKYEGLTHEPMDGFNLKEYILWAKDKLKQKGRLRASP